MLVQVCILNGSIYVLLAINRASVEVMRNYGKRGISARLVTGQYCQRPNIIETMHSYILPM